MIQAQDPVPGATPDRALAPLAEEMAAFRARLPEMLARCAGRYVLVKGAEILGDFPDRAAATREGYRRLGDAPFLVRRVADDEPGVYLPNATV